MHRLICPGNLEVLATTKAGLCVGLSAGLLPLLLVQI